MNTNVKCEEVEPLLTAYNLDELPDARAEEVREHLLGCASCNAASDEIAATLGLVCEALADAPASVFNSSYAELTQRPRTWVQRMRKLLDLPLEGPIASNLWAGALAKAAIILLVPLSVAMAILIPAFRTTHNVAGLNPPAAGTARESDDEDSGYVVDLMPSPVVAKHDVTSPETIAPVLTAVAVSSTSALDSAIEDLHAPSLVHNELPQINKLGLGKPDARDAANLASMSATIAVQIAHDRAAERQRSLAELSTLQQKMASHIKTGGKPRIISTMASPPPATNRVSIAPVTGSSDSSSNK